MDYEIAHQEVAEAEWRLAKTVIRAPFTARVTERFITLGQHLRPGDELFTVADYDPLVARIYLPERDVIELEEGREVRITPAADTGLSFTGRIRQIAPVVDTATGTVKVTVEAVQPPDGVRPGAFVAIDIVRERHATALLLPRESVIRELRTAHVFVTEDDMAVKKAGHPRDRRGRQRRSSHRPRGRRLGCHRRTGRTRRRSEDQGSLTINYEL